MKFSSANKQLSEYYLVFIYSQKVESKYTYWDKEGNMINLDKK